MSESTSDVFLREQEILLDYISDAKQSSTLLDIYIRRVMKEGMGGE